jgi:hypothetical protein
MTAIADEGRSIIVCSIIVGRISTETEQGLRFRVRFERQGSKQLPRATSIIVFAEVAGVAAILWPYFRARLSCRIAAMNGVG